MMFNALKHVVAQTIGMMKTINQVWPLPPRWMIYKLNVGRIGLISNQRSRPENDATQLPFVFTIPQRQFYRHRTSLVHVRWDHINVTSADAEDMLRFISVPASFKAYSFSLVWSDKHKRQFNCTRIFEAHICWPITVHLEEAWHDVQTFECFFFFFCIKSSIVGPAKLCSIIHSEWVTVSYFVVSGDPSTHFQARSSVPTSVRPIQICSPKEIRNSCVWRRHSNQLWSEGEWMINVCNTVHSVSVLCKLQSTNQSVLGNSFITDCKLIWQQRKVSAIVSAMANAVTLFFFKC